MKFRTVLLSNTGLIFIGSNVARQAKTKVHFRIKVILFDLGFEQSLVTKKQASALCWFKEFMVAN